MNKTYKVATFGATVMTFCFAGSALSFHDGGVGRCNACHTIHNSELNASIDEISSLPSQFTTGPFLLRAPDRSSACLNCHGEGTENNSYHVYTEGADLTSNLVPAQLGPGGDFSWLVVGNVANVKNRRGHNVIASSFGLSEDTEISTSPGGDFPADKLACSSCHDPHGRYRVIGGTLTQVTTGATTVQSGSYGGNSFVDISNLPSDEAVGVYRLLGGVDYTSDGEVTPFENSAPIALTPINYNSPATLGGVRVAYGSDFSEWCLNCHNNIHSGTSSLLHPAGNNAFLGTTIAINYNSYVSTGINTGTQADSYLTLVPFETGQGYSELSSLNDLIDKTTGPDASANVLCLSCHRAHASAFEHMFRWDIQAEPFLVTSAGVYYLPEGLDQEQVVAGYYNKPASDFGAYQRSLCNKCHAKD